MSKSNILVREGKKNDCKEIRRLIQELADFEKMPNGPRITVETLEKDGFETSPPLFGCFVAEDTESGIGEDSRLVGYALYFYAYSTWNGRKLFLEDIFVSKPYRGRHVGAMLFKEVAKKTVTDGCAYMEFMMLSWNPAKSFYESRGCVNVTQSEDWSVFRLKGESLHKTAQS